MESKVNGFISKFFGGESSEETETVETTEEQVEENEEVQGEEEAQLGESQEEEQTEEEESYEEQEGEQEGEEVQGEGEEETEKEIVKVLKNIEYKDFFSENKDKIKNYLEAESLDVEKLNDLEAVELKLKKENPTWSKEDIKDEMESKYMVGESLDNYDEHDPEYKAIKKAQRQLKSDSHKAKEYLNEWKESVSLPEFERELEIELEKTKQEENTEQGTDRYSLEEYQQMVQEQKDKEWIPLLNDKIKEVDSIEKVIEIEDGDSKVTIPINYKLSDENKGELLEYLSDWAQHPSDNKFIDEKTGNVDYQGWLKSHSEKLNINQLLKITAKEAYTKAKEDFYKKEGINFTEGSGANANSGTPSSGELSSILKQMRENSNFNI